MAKTGTKKSPQIVSLIKEDHRKVKEIFKQFEEAESTDEKQQLVRKAIKELKVHTQLEEEIVYPAMREVSEEDLMDEAAEEHHVAKLIIQELESMKPTDQHYDAKFTVLAENVQHHIKEEENEMLPDAKEIDSEELAERWEQRKEELMSSVGAIGQEEEESGEEAEEEENEDK